MSHGQKASLRKGVSAETQKNGFFFVVVVAVEVKNKEKRVLSKWNTCVATRGGCIWPPAYLGNGGKVPTKKVAVPSRGLDVS